jgi:hypothetical protein
MGARPDVQDEAASRAPRIIRDHTAPGHTVLKAQGDISASHSANYGRKRAGDYALFRRLVDLFPANHVYAVDPQMPAMRFTWIRRAAWIGCFTSATY